MDMEFVCSRSLLSCADYSSLVCYEGSVLQSDLHLRDTNRRVSARANRKRTLLAGEEPNIACDLVLVDNSGPVLVTLWGIVALNWYCMIGTAAGRYVRFDGMRVGTSFPF